MKTSTASATRATPHGELYDADFFEWTQRAADLLRRRRFNELDIEHAAEEIEDMGKRDLNELNSRLQVLIAHLLKWKFQPRKRSTSWRATIGTQRLEIEGVLEQSPSLRSRLSAGLGRNYERAVKRAVLDTNLTPQTFPSKCPFSIDEVLNESFLPD